MQKSNLDIMHELRVKLEDVKNSSQSLMEKIGQIEVELFNHPDKELEKDLGDMLTKTSESYECVKETLERYTMRINALES